MVCPSFRLVSRHATHNVAVLARISAHRSASHAKMDYQLHNEQNPRKLANSTMVLSVDRPNRRRRCDKQQQRCLDSELGNPRNVPILGSNDRLLRHHRLIKLSSWSDHRHSGTTRFEESKYESPCSRFSRKRKTVQTAIASFRFRRGPA